jgi:serine protease Do
MTTKKIIASALISIGVLVSITASFGTHANAITFKESASQNLERTMPEPGKLLSYYDSIKEPKKSVVNIFTKKTVKQQAMQNPFMSDPFFKEFFGKDFSQAIPKDRVERSLGSGVIVSADGYIVTNNHVVDGADSIMVILPDTKKELKAKVIGVDPRTDIAVIKVEEKGLAMIAFADSSKVREGDVVFAIGNPFGVGETVTQGIVSALNKSGIGINDYENFIQTDASINPGNSGGALVDSKGSLVGISTAIISPTGQNNGIGFAIPSNMVKKIAKDLVEKGKVERGRVGIVMKDMSEKERKYYGRDTGVIVMDIEKGSPAESAGLKRGDLIVSVNGAPVESGGALKNHIGTLGADSSVALDILRGGKKILVNLKLQKLNDKAVQASDANFELLEGLGLVDINDATRKKYNIAAKVKGALIVSIKEGSVAAKVGFAEGDVIFQIEDKETADVAGAMDAKKLYGDIKNKKIFVSRKGSTHMVIVDE